MPDLSAERQYEIMSPIWERCPELRPAFTSTDGTTYTIRKQRNGAIVWLPVDADPQQSDVEMISPVAPEIFEVCSGYKMVEWLAKRNATPWILIGMEGFSVGVCINHAMINFGAPTLIEALASACSAVLYTAAEKETEADG